MKMYGSTKEEVEANIDTIHWLPNHGDIKLRFTKINSVAEKLQKISNELEQYPDLIKHVQHPADQFNWRIIAGTNRLSPHSFGIAIDIDLKYSNYWEWDNPDWKAKGENIDIKYINHIPLQIVVIFRKHGFIWGGMWYHYDTMHFEYRPEMLE